MIIHKFLMIIFHSKGQMDEIQACMISISDVDSKAKENRTTPLKTDISNRLARVLKQSNFQFIGSSISKNNPSVR